MGMNQQQSGGQEDQIALGSEAKTGLQLAKELVKSIQSAFPSLMTEVERMLDEN